MTRHSAEGPEDEREMDEERDAFCRLCDGAPVVRDGLCAKCGGKKGRTMPLRSLEYFARQHGKVLVDAPREAP